MTMMVLLTGFVGVAAWFSFLGFMLWWTKALPLIVIVTIVGALLLYDWLMTLRYGDGWERRR